MDNAQSIRCVARDINSGSSHAPATFFSPPLAFLVLVLHLDSLPLSLHPSKLSLYFCPICLFFITRSFLADHSFIDQQYFRCETSPATTAHLLYQLPRPSFSAAGSRNRTYINQIEYLVLVLLSVVLDLSAVSAFCQTLHLSRPSSGPSNPSVVSAAR